MNTLGLGTTPAPFSLRGTMGTDCMGMSRRVLGARLPICAAQFIFLDERAAKKTPIYRRIRRYEGSIGLNAGIV